MDLHHALSYGAFGALLVEGLAFVGAIQGQGDWPWRLKGQPHLMAYIAAIVVRTVLSAGLAVVFAQSGQVAGPIAAVAIGIATPVLVQKLGQQVIQAVGFLPSTPDSAALTSQDEEPAGRRTAKRLEASGQTGFSASGDGDALERLSERASIPSGEEGE